MKLEIKARDGPLISNDCNLMERNLDITNQVMMGQNTTPCLKDADMNLRHRKDYALRMPCRRQGLLIIPPQIV